MTYITIDTNKKQAQRFLEFAKTLSFVKIHSEPNADTLNAMDEAISGKTKKHKSSKDLIAFLNK